MKVFIAYDGSEAADTAIDELRRAGLPADCSVEVVRDRNALINPE